MVVPGVTLNSWPPSDIFPFSLAALQSWASTLLGSLKVTYHTTPPAELNPQYWLITDSITIHQKTGTVLSFFICTISPKMVRSTSWWSS
jgi:hypothetical protein